MTSGASFAMPVYDDPPHLRGDQNIHFGVDQLDAWELAALEAAEEVPFLLNDEALDPFDLLWNTFALEELDVPALLLDPASVAFFSPQPIADAPTHATSLLDSVLDGVDVPGDVLDLGMGVDAAFLGINTSLGAIHSAVDGSPSWMEVFTPSTVSMPKTPDGNSHSPSAGSPAADQPATSHTCTTCWEPFPTQHQLSKHQRRHIKPEICPVCHVQKAALRDLHRHIWTDHKDYATRARIPSEMRLCPVRGCGYEGRKDNIARHCKKKHGKALKWRRGVPCLQ